MFEYLRFFIKNDLNYIDDFNEIEWKFNLLGFFYFF